MVDQECSNCHEPLIIEVEPDSDVEESKTAAVPESIPDDVELSCGCHFHWECFLEAYSITQCPNCSKDISSLSPDGQQQVLCTVRNEGGVQDDFDILPSATEEAYLRAYPEERKGHAFLEFCREGDIDAIVHMIKDQQDDDADDDLDEKDDPENAAETLRYQGTFEGIEGSGLHVAIRYGREDIAWLLLALASTLDWSKFPQAVLQGMQGFDLSPSDRTEGTDIRTLKDSEGRTSQALAEELGGVWTSWIQAGRFSA